MSYVSFNDVIELSGILKDKGLNFRIHLRDTCGRQSASGSNHLVIVPAKDDMMRCIK